MSLQEGMMRYEPDAAEDFSDICEFLGLGDDPDSHATYATEAHRCYHMQSPTRIALRHQENYCLGASHVTCPVFQGEGAGAPRAGAPAAAVPSGRAPSPPPGRGRPLPATEAAGRRPPRMQPERSGAPRPRGAPGPRPRAGGPSIPMMTVGLFALAIVVIGVAVFINQAVGGDDGDEQASGVLSGLDRTRTAQARAGTQQTPTQPPAQQTQTAQSTQTRTTTPGTTTSTTTATAGTPTTTSPAGRTYTVKSGDFCGTIAEAHNITLQQLLAANNMVEADCNTLQVGRVLKIP